jgi:thiamine monophosphate synthase
LRRRAPRECEVVYVTGRPERCREATLAWFTRHGLPEGRLRMRRDGDRRPARLSKPQLLRSLARGRTVAVVVDDDAQVCAAYREAGWRVLQADWMTAGPALEQAQEQDGRT